MRARAAPLLLLCVLLCACTAGADDSAAKPKPARPKPQLPLSASLGLLRGTPMGLARRAARGYELVRPYVANPQQVARAARFEQHSAIIRAQRCAAALESALEQARDGGTRTLTVLGCASPHCSLRKLSAAR